MAGRIAAAFIIFSIHGASPASTITVSNITSVASSATIITQASNSSSSPTHQESSTSPPNQGLLSPKPASSYEVTENVIDIPDDRPNNRPSIVPTFKPFKPLNLANTNITIHKVTRNDTGDENHEPKKVSITYIHITKENNNGGGIKKFFRGFKDYVVGLKRGVVDGLHKYFHKNDKIDEKVPKNVDDDGNVEDFHKEFHRNFHSDEVFDDYEHDFHHKHDFKHDHEFEDY